MRATYSEYSRWAIPCRMSFIYIVLFISICEAMNWLLVGEIVCQRGEVICPQGQMTHELCSEGFNPGRLAPAVSRKSWDHTNANISSLDPIKWRQFYCLHSCQCYLYWNDCQISHPVLGSVLYFYFIEKVFAFNTVWSRWGFWTHPWRLLCWTGSQSPWPICK